jgi:hypothetical protein
MSGIFISYRRDDSAGHAGRLFDRLREQFGRAEDGARVFMDVEGIAPGADFVQAIDKAVAASDVTLAIIGPAWLDCKDAHGQRRLDDPEDFVRLEIVSALRRNKIVIPVLVHEAEMPAEDLLPQELKSLARRQAVTLTDTNWESDMAQLQSTLRGLLGRAAPPAVIQDPRLWSTLVQLLAKPIPLALLVALAAGAYAWRTFVRPVPPIAVSRPAPVELTPAPAAGNDGARTQRQGASTPLAPALRASAAALDFGTLRMGRDGVQEVRISNSGAEAAEISQIGFAGEAQADYSFERKCDRKELTPNASCDLRIRFAPSEVGPRKALLSVEYYGRASPLIVKLWGQGASNGEANKDKSASENAANNGKGESDKVSSAAK